MTCEDYVTKRLSKVEKELDAANAELTQLRTDIQFAREAIRFVGSLFTVKTSNSNERYITLSENIWESYDEDKYQRLMCLFRLEGPDEEDAEDETTDTV